MIRLEMKNYHMFLTLFRMEEGGKKALPPTSFSRTISTNVGISLQTFLILTLLPHWCKISCELELTPLLKKSGFYGQILTKLRLS